MPELWMPGVPRYDTERRLTMRGDHDARIFTHHSFEAPYTYSPDCRAAAKYLASQKSDATFVYHPITGAIIQMLPMNSGARTLRASDPVTGVGVSTNTWGAVHAQVEVIAFARNPWTADLTAAGRETLRDLLEFLGTWGIPPRWCHGIRPPAYPGPGVSKMRPTESGHYHHAGWVANNHGDPGAIADPWTAAYAETEPSPMIKYPKPSRLKTDQFWRDIEAVIRSEGFEVYCGRSHFDRGACAPGKHSHGATSRHFVGRALDFGRDYGSAVSARERIYVSAKIRMLRDYYGPEMGWVFDRGRGDHDDHGHLQDRPNEVNGQLHNNTLTTVTMYGDRGTRVETWQDDLNESGVAVLTEDGVFGLKTFWATRIWQALRGLTVDGIVGAGSRAEMKRHLVELEPKPDPKPIPVPPPERIPDMSKWRIAGPSRIDTAAVGAMAHPKDRVYLAVTDIDATLAASYQDGAILLVREQAEELPQAVVEALLSIKPSEVFASGGPIRVSDAILYKARKLLGLPIE